MVVLLTYMCLCVAFQLPLNMFCMTKSRNEHETYNYVDDSSHLITFSDLNQVKLYVEKFYILIHNIYMANLLKVNADKTKIMLFTANNQNIDSSRFSCKCYDYTIKPKHSIIILGYKLSSNLSPDNHVNYLSQQCFNRINVIRSLNGVTDQQTRL